MPAAKLSIQISGLLLILGSFSIAFGVYADLGALIIAVLLAIIAVKMHDFWTQTDAQQKQNEMTQFLKDISLAGAALVFFATKEMNLNVVCSQLCFDPRVASCEHHYV